MRFEKLSLDNVRIIESQVIYPGKAVNLIHGKNGSGKTSILEAIHLLSRAKSFRTPKINELLKNGQQQLLVSGQIDHDRLGTVTAGFSRQDSKSRIRFQSSPVQSISEQAASLPIITQTTESHSLLTGGPKIRRKWLDWYMFHVEPKYLSSWKKYHTALRSRNLLLRKNSQSNELDAWEHQMVEFGKNIIQMSQEAISHIDEVFKTKADKILDGNVGVIYTSTVENISEYKEILKKNRIQDKERGFTLNGPHRSNIDFLIDDQKASKFLSRGQSKLYISAQKLAEIDCIIEKIGIKPIFLLDDVAAELDSESRAIILHELESAGVQSFITTTEANVFPESQTTLFHVERGCVKDGRISN